MNQPLVNLSVSPELVKPILEAKISAAVCEAMQGHENFLNSIVSRVLSQKVDSEGKTSGYVRDDSPMFVQWMAEKAIKDATKEAVLAWVKSEQPKIQKAIELALRKSTSKIAAIMVEHFAGSFPEYRINAEIKFEQK